MPSLRSALVLTLTAAAATAVPAGAAMAAPAPLPTQAVTDALPTGSVTGALPTQMVTGTLTGATAAGIAPVTHLTLDPLSNTGVDPLDNAIGGQIADFKPLSTSAATDPVTHGASLSTLPLVGPATGLLPG
ncbi:hypothetical protein [Streptomyces sp. CA-111067]|uniref:hypothetical protein n=1 Tax=Streptomyces sp. CA-111067 TaxID=3240046 RepID=UPI003D951C52